MSSTDLRRDQSSNHNASGKDVRVLPSVAIRFSGDSGDGMQLAGTQFTDTSAVFGNDISTFPDFPAEIRAPAGTTFGVSGFQIHFSSNDIFTPGDAIDALVAMNPAALKTNISSVREGGIIIINEDAFVANDLKKAGYAANPLEDGSLSRFQVIRVPINKLTAEAARESGLGAKDIDRCKNMFALGLCYWLYDRPLETTLSFFEQKFGKKNPLAAKANSMVLRAGYNYGETAELFPLQYRVPAAKLPAGQYRKITGNEAVAIGMVAASQLCNTQLVYCSYPITPASDILHELSNQKNFDVVTFQAEDEIAAMGAAIGASFGGKLGCTGTSGPGMALKTEAIGLAVMTELPVVIVNVQRGGPSTGLPTKTEQADLLQAVWGRNGECPLPVLAAASPSDCFAATVEAFQIAVRYMTPVILLTDGYIGNSSEPWQLPSMESLKKFEVKHPDKLAEGKTFEPYRRNEEGARPWAIPGMPGFEHRLGGLEKQNITGAVSYDFANHDTMVRLRAAKVAGIKPVGQDLLITGETSGDVLVLGWGGTFGSIKAGVLEAQQRGLKVTACHVRYLNPLPERLGELCKNFKHILVPELNLGQLAILLRNRFLLDVKSLTKVRGQPFTIAEIQTGIEQILCGEQPHILQKAGEVALASGG